ncbi:hypothetical protein C0216_28615 [Streptomyces globosus]|uniref:Uncharacterized protein n=1 Tax=Streptomyces globosus TaxID=68209 RepID=A0A344UAB3_9ACTN|nr:hypothetical protein C0216_28615 [Streptomyces globosus]
MSSEQTTMSGPVHLSLPSPPPDPVSGCLECLGIAVTRANARSVGDHSKATDANVVLRTHLREDHGAE